VGAGLAGLRAASRLCAAGAEVFVVEERAEVGGKAALVLRDGLEVDRSLQAFLFDDRRLLSWMQELAVGESLLPLRPVHTAQLHSGRIVATRARSLVEIGRTPGVTWRDRARLLRLPRLMRRYAAQLDPERPELAADLDYRSVADFARLYFGRSVLERFVTPRVTADTLGDERELSRVAFLLHWQASLRGAARTGIAARALGELAAAAAQGLDVRTESRAQQIKELSSGRLALECADEVSELDALVLATSAAEAGRLAAGVATPAERDFLAGVRSAPLVTLNVATSRPLSGLPQLVRVPHVEASPIEVLLVEPGVPGGRAREGGSRVTVCARQSFGERNAGADDDRVERTLLSSLERIFPSLRRSLLATALHRDPVGVPRFEVGAYRELARFQRVQQDRRHLGRRLYFAGDYLAGPRFEDAVASGARAATAVISDLGS
jgi:protoporphyrinogen oxidase